MQGPEDTPQWKKEYNLEVKTNIGADCVICGNEMTLAHCAESGCPWCARCGANANKKEK